MGLIDPRLPCDCSVTTVGFKSFCDIPASRCSWNCPNLWQLGRRHGSTGAMTWPHVCDCSDDSGWYIPAAVAAAGIAQNLAAEYSMVQDVRYVLSITVQITPAGPLSGTGRHVGPTLYSLRPLWLQLSSKCMLH